MQQGDAQSIHDGDAADRPIAYNGANNDYVQRFDGSAWGPLTSTADDTFTRVQNGQDVAVAPDGRIYVAKITDGRRSACNRSACSTATSCSGASPDRRIADARMVVIGSDVYLAASVVTPVPDRTNEAINEAVLLKLAR